MVLFAEMSSMGPRSGEAVAAHDGDFASCAQTLHPDRRGRLECATRPRHGPRRPKPTASVSAMHLSRTASDLGDPNQATFAV